MEIHKHNATLEAKSLSTCTLSFNFLLDITQPWTTLNRH